MNNLPTATLSLDLAWIGEAPKQSDTFPEISPWLIECFGYHGAQSISARCYAECWREMMAE